MSISSTKGLFALAGALLLLSPLATHAALAQNQSGKILLDVEHKGEAWYVDPVSGQRVFLANGAVAYDVLRDYGLGISDADLAKIPVGFIPVAQSPSDTLDQLQSLFNKCDPTMSASAVASAFKAALEPLSPEMTVEADPKVTGKDVLCFSGTLRDLIVSDKHIPMIKSGLESLTGIFNDNDKDRVGYVDETQFGTSPWEVDSDADGYEDGVEIESGFSPLGKGKVATDAKLVNRLKGRIVLQVQGVGQAWYINPADGRRYYLATGADAYRVMSQLGVGAPSSLIEHIAATGDSDKLYKAINSDVNPCDSFDCFDQAIVTNVEMRSVLTLSSTVNVDPSLSGSGSARVLARYIPGSNNKSYVSFELIQLDAGPMKGNEVVDALASNEMLPEGMTTEEKAQLASDVEVIYAHLMADVVDMTPRLTCVIKDRDQFLNEWRFMRQTIEQNFSGGINSDSVGMTQDQLEAESQMLEESTTVCSWQGGALR